MPQDGEGYSYDDDHVFAYMDEDCGDDEELEEECGQMPDGTCMLIGTEHCDWDCGRLAAQRIEAMKAPLQKQRNRDPTFDRYRRERSQTRGRDD